MLSVTNGKDKQVKFVAKDGSGSFYAWNNGNVFEDYENYYVTRFYLNATSIFPKSEYDYVVVG